MGYQYCPRCGAEYVAGVERCSDCLTELVYDKPSKPLAADDPISIGSLRALQWVAMGVGIGWLIAISLFLLARIAEAPGPVSPSNPCPSCPGDPYANAGYFVLLTTWGLAMAAAALMFRLLKNSPGSARSASLVVLVGLFLLGAYGLGLYLLVPGLLILLLSTKDVPWLSLWSGGLILAGTLAFGALFLDVSEPWRTVFSVSASLAGVGAIRLSVDARRHAREAQT